jgi:hypothetical protein
MTHDDVPAELSYLLPMAERCSGMWFSTDIERFIIDLTPPLRAELAHLYEMIRDHNDLEAALTWINSSSTTQKGKLYRHGALILLQLFDELGHQNEHPFSDGTVRYSVRLAPRDWTGLPSQLSYLTPTAEAFGVPIIENGWDVLGELIGAEERRSLEGVGERIREHNDYPDILSWLNSRPATDSAVQALDRLCELLDSLGIGLDASAS